MTPETDGNIPGGVPIPSVKAKFKADGTPQKAGYVGEGVFLIALKPTPKGRQVGDDDAESAARGCTVDIPYQLMDGVGNPVWAMLYLDPRTGQLVINPHYGDRETPHVP